MDRCRLWTSAFAGRIFFNPIEDRREILNWWRKNKIKPDNFSVCEEGIYLEFYWLDDSGDTLQIIFSALMERIEESAVIRFEHWDEDKKEASAIFIGRKLFLKVPYVPDKSKIPVELWNNQKFREVFGKE